MPRLEPRRARILVAEDDAAILELLTVRLELAGHHVVPARDGAMALERLAAGRPNAAVLDVNMPRVDGFGVLAALRENPLCATVPVLMLTARNAPSDVVRARALGADDYLTKPFDDQQLLARVARLLARGRTAGAPPPTRPTGGGVADDAFLI